MDFLENGLREYADPSAPEQPKDCYAELAYRKEGNETVVDDSRLLLRGSPVAVVLLDAAQVTVP